MMKFHVVNSRSFHPPCYVSTGTVTSGDTTAAILATYLALAVTTNLTLLTDLISALPMAFDYYILPISLIPGE